MSFLQTWLSLGTTTFFTECQPDCDWNMLLEVVMLNGPFRFVNTGSSLQSISGPLCFVSMPSTQCRAVTTMFGVMSAPEQMP